MSITGTEIIDPDIPRVDAVDGPAHGMPFILLKSADTSAAPVRKADPMADPTPDAETLDLTETPNVDGTTVDPEKAGDANLPGSPTWEAVDAAGARTALSQLTSLRSLVNGLAAREAAEGDDCETEWDLSDASDAIDYAMGVLAKFAVDEQAEADDAADQAEAEARAMGLIKALRLDETPVLKAGRVLSAANESALRQAADAITAILTQLDTAPLAAEGGEAVVTKSQDPSTPLPLAIQQLLSQLSVAYTAWEADGTAPATPDPTVATPDPAAPAADPAADPAATDPAGAAVTPDPTTPAVAPATAPVDPNAVTKSVEAQTALEKSLAERIEALVAERTAAIEKRLAVVESTPVAGGPMLNGAVGADTAGSPAEELRKQLAQETDPGRRMEALAALISSGSLPQATL